MAGPVIPGIRRVRLDTGEFYFFFNLATLTTEVAFGLPGHNEEGGTHLNFWSNDTLARMLFDPGVIDGAPTDGPSLPMSDEARIETDALIAGCVFNDRAIQLARTPDGFNSTLQKDGATVGPTILAIPQQALRASQTFYAKYRTLFSSRTYWVRPGTKDIHDYLDRFRTDYIEPVRQYNKILNREVLPTKHAIGRFQAAYLAMVAMFDFAGSRSERKQAWGTHAPVEKRPWAFQSTLLLREPHPRQRENAEYLRDNVLAPLLGHLSNLLAWQLRGDTVKGKVFGPALFRNSAAKTLLQKLREDPILLGVFDDAPFVAPALWLRVESLLLDAFEQLSTCPETMESLLDSELLAAARIASRGDIELPSSGTIRERELAAAIQSFVPETELVETPTPLSKRLALAFTSVKTTRGVRAAFYDPSRTSGVLASRFVAPILEKIKRIAKDSKHSESTARAWLFRALVTNAAIEQSMLTRTWEELNEAASALRRHRTRKFLNVSSTKYLAEVRKPGSSIALSGAGTLLSLFVLYEAVEESTKDGTEQTLDILSGGLLALGSIGELADSMKSAPSFFTVLPRRIAPTMGRVSSYIGGIPILKGAVPMGAWLTFVAAALSASSKSTATQGQKEIANDTAVLSALAVMVSLVQLATKATLPGLVLLVGQLLITTRDTWLPAVLPNVEKIPAVGNFVRSVWAATESDADFQKKLRKSPFSDDIRPLMNLVDGLVQDTQESDDGFFWSLAQPNPILQGLAASLVCEQYGLSKDIGVELVSD